MRLLGIDYGTKRVGTALSDEEGRMAFPHVTFPNDEKLFEKIVALVQEKSVETIVVGKSHDLDGAPNALQEKIDVFVKDLEEVLRIPIILELEQFTTQAALRLQGRTPETDSSAAALILDSYIMKHNHD